MQQLIEQQRLDEEAAAARKKGGAGGGKKKGQDSARYVCRWFIQLINYMDYASFVSSIHLHRTNMWIFYTGTEKLLKVALGRNAIGIYSAYIVSVSSTVFFYTLIWVFRLVHAFVIIL